MGEKLKYLIIGSSGMVGHVIALYLQEHGHKVIGYDILPFPTIETIIGDFHDIEKIRQHILNDEFNVVVNCTAVINEDAEKNKDEAAFINVFFPHYLEKITEGTSIVIVHRSTDCIFSGNRGGYTLSDVPDGKSFYARTKALGEINNVKDISLRTSLIGPETDEDGGSLFNWFYNQHGEVNGFVNAMWTGLTTIEFAKIIDELVCKKAHGLFQCVPNCCISKYELLCMFEQYFPANRRINRIENKLVDKSLIQEMNGIKIHIADYDTMIAEMAMWIKTHKNIYSNYFKGDNNE